MATEILWRAPGKMTQFEQRSLELLVEDVSDEFVPPLTTQSSTTQEVLASAGGSALSSYFDEMLMQHCLLLIERAQLQGFLSFRILHRDARLPQIGICIYVSTISVRPAVRGRGFARLLYQELLELPETLPAWILLRTRSTNTHHLQLLNTLGFKHLLTVPNDRDSGVDSIYLGRKR
ncbi:MAG TPA: GNAT family N-acetyltransferase [Pseudonocardiaceae bacterium]|nr:GNAT family N-acetyltransferase [Pseudonocardiaceae bacterium]